MNALPSAHDRLVALAHALEPVMMLAADAQHAMPLTARGVIDGLLRIRLQLARYQVWVINQAKRSTP